MGKGAIIIALAALMATSAIYLTQDQSSTSRIEEEVDYQEQVLAREAAQSAFNIVAAKVKRDFDGYRGSYSNLPFRKSTYDISATEEDDGSVSIIGTGRYGNHEYTIAGIVDRSGTRLLDALTLDGPLNQFDIRNSGLISGRDTELNGSEGPGPDVHSVLAMDADVRTSILGLGIDSKLLGVNGQGDVISGTPEVDLDALESAILNYSGVRLSAYDGDRTFGSTTFGTRETPGLLRVDGDLTLEEGFTGYGVVYVTGSFRMSDTARWVGLVLANNTEGQQHAMSDDSNVRGVVVLRSAADVSDPDPSEEGEKSDKSDKVTICHYPPGNPDNRKTLTIGASALNAHLAHGDEEGACPDDDEDSGKSGKSGKSGNRAGLGSAPVAVVASVVADWSRTVLGAALRSDESEAGGKVTICHIPPGNPANRHTITVGAPAKNAHMAHGDEEGECGNDVETVPADPVSFEMSDDAHIVYSSRALKSLEEILEQIRIEEEGLNVRQTSEAPRKLSNRMKTY